MRSGTGDCGCQVQGETCWGLVTEGRVRALGVVVGHPSRDQITGMGQVAQQRLADASAPRAEILLNLVRSATMSSVMTLSRSMDPSVAPVSATILTANQTERVTEAPMPVFGKGRVVGNRSCQIETAKPAIGEVQMTCLEAGIRLT